MSIQLKRGTSNSWTTQNPILLEGQPGVETRGESSPRIKIGDGSTAWSSLKYAAPDAEIYQDTKIVSQDSAFGIDAGGIALESSDFITLRANRGSTGLLIDSWSVSPNASGESNMTLGTQDHPWNTIWITNPSAGSGSSGVSGIRCLLNSPTYQVYIKPSAVYSMTGGFYLGMKTSSGSDENHLVFNIPNNIISDATRSSWIQFTSDSVKLGLGSNFTDMYSMELTSEALLPGPAPGPSYKTLGSETDTWQAIYLRDMVINYNDNEECLEFLAS